MRLIPTAPSNAGRDASASPLLAQPWGFAPGARGRGRYRRRAYSTLAAGITCVLLLGAVLAGCTPPASEWTPAESPKAPRVDLVRFEHDAAFAPGGPGLAEGEGERLGIFLDEAQVTPEDHIYVIAASDDRLATSRIGQLIREIAPRGLGAERLPAQATGVLPDHLLVVVDRYVVTPPDCPDWTKAAVGDHSNTVAGNFGCADAVNLGLMVANPRDLVVGRPLGPPEGDTALFAIARYRDGKPKLPGEGGNSNGGSGITVSLPPPSLSGAASGAAGN